MRRLRVLGPLEVDGAAEVLGPRDRVVVSALALRPGQRVDAETLAEALWGEQPPASAAKVVQGCVSRLRKALGADAIETVDGGYRVRSDELDIDRQQFEDQVERARGYLATRTPERAIPLLGEALSLWRGPAFGELEDWMPGRLEAVRLGQLRLSAEEDLLQARLDSGDHAGVATDGTVLTGQQPFRERRWALLALAQYRCGRQADALASIRSARRALGEELGLDPGSELVLLEGRILAQDPGLANDHAARLADQSCPWKGLAAYGDHDGETFFGRDADIAACRSRLKESPLLVVTGPSGSGKSSLVQAGLVPALRREGAEVEVFTPGADGALAMAAARGRRAGDPVLVIDQFEETFTLREAAFARPWLADVARYARDCAPVVVVVRGDHVAELGSDGDLARLAERGLHLVAPLAGDRLREAIEGPARVAGLRLEPGLVDLVVRDADGQPGALPLLSHALTETWRRREAGLLTVDGYRAVGGIHDAVAASAERLYDGLRADERTALRWLMLRLVSLSDGGEPFRTPLPASVVAALDPLRHRLLDLLVRGRLVTSRDGGYDLAHEALVRAWPRLRAWLDEDLAGQQLRRHLAMTAAGWEALGRADNELYRGSRLAAALDWLEREHEPLADSEREFVAASRAVADEQNRRLAEEADLQRRRNRRLRGLVVVVVALALVAAAAGAVARQRGQDAEARRAAAAAAAVRGEHNALVARSLALRSTSLAVASLLAVTAWRTKSDAPAESAMLASLTAEPALLGYRFVGLGTGPGAAAVPGGQDILVPSGNAVRLLHPRTGELSPAFGRSGPGADFPSDVRVSADGTRAVQLQVQDQVACPGQCRQLVVIDLVSSELVGSPIDVPFAATDVAISRNGKRIAAAGTGGSFWDIGLWDADTGHQVAQARLQAKSVAFGPGGHLLVGTRHGMVRELRMPRLQVVRSWRVPPGSTDAGLVVVDHRVIVAGDGHMAAIDLTRPGLSWAVPTRCVELTVAASLERAYCAQRNGLIEERDLVSGRLTGRVIDPQLAIGAMVVTSGADGAVELVVQGGADEPQYGRWRLDGPGVGGQLVAPGAVLAGGFDPDGRNILVRRDGTTEVVDRSGNQVLVLPRPGRAGWLSSGVVGIVGRRSVLVSVPTGDVVPIHIDGVDRLFPGTDAQGWAVSEDDDGVAVQAFSFSSGRAIGPSLGPIEHASDAAVVADARRLLVTSRHVSPGGLNGSWETDEYDLASRQRVGSGLDGMSAVALLPGGAILVADEIGRVSVYSDLSAGPDRELGRIVPGITSLQVSDEGDRAVATTDGAVYVFDPRDGRRYGDAIATVAPDGVIAGSLDPNGGTLLTSTADGVVMWDTTPQVMAQRLCALAGRNPTYAEWSTYVGDETPYHAPCPGYTSAVDQLDQTQ